MRRVTCKEGLCISTDSLLSTEICTWKVDEIGQSRGERGVRWNCFVEMYHLRRLPNTKTRIIGEEVSVLFLAVPLSMSDPVGRCKGARAA
jgi:hypothetical protein